MCVGYEFCMSELSQHHESPDADTWDLAKVVAEIGVNNADSAIYDTKALLAKPSTDAKTTRPRSGSACQKLYDEVNKRNYAAGKEKVGEAIPLAHQCDNVFASAIPSPLTKCGSYSVLIAIVCTAITNLIK